MSVKKKRTEKSEGAKLRRKIAALQQRVALLEEVIDSFPGGIILTDNDHNILICNHYQRMLHGFPESLFDNKKLKLQDLFRFNATHGEYGPCDVEELVASKMVLVEKRETHHYERTRPNGSVMEVRGVPLSQGGFVSCCMDVTENRRHQAMVKDLALTDPLTGLANRRLLLDRFEQANARAKRGECFAVHYIDLDHFKPINDRLGHKAGDTVLIEVARRLQAATRETDTVARIGGDEFVIMQSNAVSAKSTNLLAHRLISAISKPIHHDGHAIQVTASVGIAISPEGESTLEEMMRQADSALYQSKQNGRNRPTLHIVSHPGSRLRGAA